MRVECGPDERVAIVRIGGDHRATIQTVCTKLRKVSNSQCGFDIYGKECLCKFVGREMASLRASVEKFVGTRQIMDIQLYLRESFRSSLGKRMKFI